MRHLRCAGERAGRDVDDPATISHPSRAFLGDNKCAHHIDVERFAEMILGKVFKLVRAGDGGIVDDDIQWRCAIHQRANGRAIADINDFGDDFSAFCAQALAKSLNAFQPVYRNDLVAVGCKTLDDTTTDAFGGARHKGRSQVLVCHLASPRHGEYFLERGAVIEQNKDIHKPSCLGGTKNRFDQGDELVFEFCLLPHEIRIGDTGIMTG